MAEAKLMFNDGFLDRAQKMSGLRTVEAFAGAIGVSESVLNNARKTNVATPAMIVGLYKAFGFQPGEVCKVRPTTLANASQMETEVAA
ncbi:hypothetical protein [Bifidobacterium eulemuris]|uniref:XRE family transcriptional regulator n=1 Tax=Bifidobacterium eulemuris TaxID=1765219 RepID=A0A261GB51_9BIFI|nr:hypothetical protein [Bifidobacterium eulemuris]OZG68206.1 hypothetical protein BEUL_1219 [Bifidobacterium eulemuris]QOL31737.1 hypothetical protein BE0216_04095 [Bifidobacterium eulemuris]